MPEPSEADCLLRTGALYSRRIGLRAGSELIFAGIKRGALSLYYGDAPIYHFDLDGRWQRAFLDGVHYLKGLDATVRAVDRVREGGGLALGRRPLAFAEAADLDARARQAAIDLLDGLGDGRFEMLAPPGDVATLTPDELRDLLERIVAWDASAWFAHRERYLATYGHPPYLPPDAQQAVLLQATLGPAAHFASGPIAEEEPEPYVRSPAEFAEHAGAVARLMGRSLLQCRSLFVGGADFLRLPPDDLASYLEIAGRTFPLLPEARGRRPRDLPDDAPGLDGIATFLDRFEPPRPDADALARLHALGLARVTLGVESGSLEIRSRFGKVWTDEDLRAAVADLDAAGIAVNLVLLANPGEPDQADRHAAATAELIESLPLRAGSWASLVPATMPSGAGQNDPFAFLKAALGPARARLGIKVVPSRPGKGLA